MIVAYFNNCDAYDPRKHRYLRRAGDVVSAIAGQRISATTRRGEPLEIEAELLFTPDYVPEEYSPEEFKAAIYELCVLVPKKDEPDYEAKLEAWKQRAFERLADVSHGTLV